MATEYDTLIQPLTDPVRPRLAEVQAAVAGAVTPAEAWALLAAGGLIPESWLADAGRGYFEPNLVLCPSCEGSGMASSGWSDCYVCYGRGRALLTEQNLSNVRETPPNLMTCISMASMSDAIAAAEPLAWLFATELAKLGLTKPTHADRSLRWRVAPTRFKDRMQRTKGGASAIDDPSAPAQSHVEFHKQIKAMMPDVHPMWASELGVRCCAMRAINAHASWELRAKQGERLISDPLKLSEHSGKLLRDLQNPYVWAVAACGLGVAIEDVFDGVVFMLVPPIGPR